MNKNTLRKHIRLQRRRLSTRAQQQAERGLLRAARQCRPLWFANRVLYYAPFEGEISPVWLMRHLPTCERYLPKIVNYRTCRMHLFSTRHSMTEANRFGISEPRTIATPLYANQLTLILLPLVAFDRSGNRLGMGAGYYDRALQALKHQVGTRPLLIGLAHSFQEVEKINAQTWDVPLDAILTDLEYIPVSSKLQTQR